MIRLGLILLVGCLSAFNAQVKISRFTPQPNSTSYQIGASRMINERFDLAVEDRCQTPIDVCEVPVQQTFDVHPTACCPIRRTPVRALTLALPLLLSLRAPPQSA